QPFHITMKFGFTRILMPNTEIRTIASGRLNLPKPGIYSPKSIINTMDQEILRNLKIYWELYQADPDEATLLANDVFFPAAFALVVNEESGPLPLVTSPKVDINDIMEEVIRLIAGLNANKIVEQYYITGSQPWSKPHGDFRWIAFFRNNIEARGNVELHVLGVVTATNLLLAKPTLNQAILGILLGTMNSYLTIIEDDGADFITKSYHHDKYFSTLSLISDSLNEMRNVCGEILAAYMSEEVI
ncbi:MAG: hypothetical protein OEY49_18900, partial [Candidatus Heimdallarchaeota archaeon]|nr:hypothetical protein [Candidatus Heimdallarchaeota archaeon]